MNDVRMIISHIQLLNVNWNGGAGLLFGGWQPVWPDWPIYGTLGYFLKPVVRLILPKSLIFLAIFEKVLKSFIFLVK